MKAYRVSIGGLEHTLLLAEEDVARYPDAVEVEGSDAATDGAVPPEPKRSTRKR